MAETWTTSELIDDIRAQGALSSDDSAFSDANCLAAANRALKAIFVPAIRSIRAEYYVTHVDETIVADQAEYRIPHRSATNSVRQVFWIDSASSKHELHPATVGETVEYERTGRPVRYAVRDDRLVLLPTPNAALGTLRILYERRPSSLVLVSSCQDITAVGVEGSETAVILSGTESTFDNLSVDIVRCKPPFSLAVRDATFDKQTVFDVDYLVYTPASWDTTPAVGDYMCLAGETCFPQIPVELHPMLALASAIKLLRPIDREYSLELQTEFDIQCPRILSSLTPRNQGRSQKLINPDSMLRRGTSSRWGSGFSDWE